MAFPRTVVDAPTRAPFGLGLFSVLTPRPVGDGRWEGSGITWEPITCGPALGIGPVICDDEEVVGLPKTLVDASTVVPAADAIVVYGMHSCSPVGRTAADAQSLAEEHLLTREEARVEQAVWTGDLGNEPNLIGSDPDVLANGVGLASGVALLEEWIGREVGSQGVIHMDRFTGLLAVALDVIEVTSSGSARTRLRTPVVVGAGYQGETGPAGATPDDGNRWIFATPALVGYRSEVFEPTNRPGDLLDRSTNDLYAVAERRYVVGWDVCGTAAVEVAVTPLGGGGGGSTDGNADVLAALSTSTSGIKSKIDTATNTVTGSVSSSEGTVTDAVAASEGNVTGAVSSGTSTVTGAITDSEGNVTDAVSSSEGTITGAVSSSQSAVVGEVGSSETTVTDRIGTAETTIIDALPADPDPAP